MRPVGTENAWFSFKGMRNDEMGVQMLSMPTRPHPARKGNLIDIPGTHGKVFQDEGVYDRILVSLRCVAVDNDNIDDVNGWLTGEGMLIFGDEPERSYNARITKEFSRSNKNPRLRGQEFTITFDCEPFRYQATPVAPIALSKSGNVTNPGTVASAPLIYIEGTGDCTLMIGRNTLIFSNIPGHIYVDCDAKIAYTGDGTASSPIVLATQYVTGEWMSIEPGENAVQYTGSGISKIILTPRWRWL